MGSVLGKSFLSKSMQYINNSKLIWLTDFHSKQVLIHYLPFMKQYHEKIEKYDVNISKNFPVKVF